MLKPPGLHCEAERTKGRKLTSSLGLVAFLLGMPLVGDAQEQNRLPSSFRRVVRRMGEAVHHTLGLDRRGICKGNRPYAERSFSNPENASQRREQLRELHAQAFGTAKTPVCTNEVVTTGTNRPPVEREQPLEKPPPP